MAGLLHKNALGLKLAGGPARQSLRRCTVKQTLRQLSPGKLFRFATLPKAAARDVVYKNDRWEEEAEFPSNHAAMHEACQQAIASWLVDSGCESATFRGLDTHMELYPVSWADGQTPAGHLVVAGTIIPDSHGTPTAVVALTAHLVQKAPGMDGQLGDVQVRAHWACSKGQGRGWKAPPPGWHTRPAQSHDAGYGSWQTALGVEFNGTKTMVLQIPLTGPLEHSGSGLALVLTTDCGRWLKAVLRDHDGHSQLTDVFFPTDNLPASLNGGVAASTSGPRRTPKPTPPQKQKPKTAPVSTSESTPARSENRNREEHAPAKQPPSITAAPAQPVEAKPADKAVAPVPTLPIKKHEVVLSPQVSQLGVNDGAGLERFIAGFSFGHRPPGEITIGGHMWQHQGVCGWMVDSVANKEPNAQRSLMHRFNEATELVGHASGVSDWNDRQSAVCAIAVWLRLSAMRLLVWNRNYNVKPREISAAQDALNSRLTDFFTASGNGQGPELRPMVRLAMSSAGRGGQGDVGQRVRDEILEVQQRNRCKGGMMEEWHQKLHNNTSPDDVVICEALLAYCQSGLDIQAYWRTLHDSNINKERLASFDRSIHSEPRFDKDQVPGLIRDLTAYLHTLRAVHCGTDLASAAANVLGYSNRDLKGSKQITVEAVPQVASAELRTLLAAALHLQQVMSSTGVGAAGQDEPHALHGTVRLMELLVEARHLIRPAVLAGDSACGGRHRDVVFLDIALETACRTALEGAMGALRECAAYAVAHPPKPEDVDWESAGARECEGESGVGELLDQLDRGEATLLESLAFMTSCHGHSSETMTSTQRLSLLIAATCLAVESAALSFYPNEELTSAMKWMNALHGMTAGELQRDRAMQALSVVDKLKRTLDSQTSALVSQLQPTVQAMSQRLGLPDHVISLFGEEVVRGTAAAPLAQLLGVVEPSLRRLIGSGEWQVVSRGGAEKSDGVTGVVVTLNTLEEVQYHTYSEPTVLVVDNLQGHEEVPEGCVAVISAHGQCPDMLSHSAVRARNMDVLLAACHSEQIANNVKSMRGRRARVQLVGQDVKVQTA